MKLNIELILLIIIILLTLYLMCITAPIETFNVNNNDIDNVLDMKNKKINNILPLFNSRGYIATYTDNNPESTNNLIYTTEIISNNWKGPIKNGGLNNNSIIVDLSYDIDKKLMCVGLELINSEPSYTIYKKEESNIDSMWMPIKSNSKTIRSINYDLNGSMIGISSFDGQIYKNNKGYWDGPINYDIPMRKVLFDTDRNMLGIGLLDNKIYKKKTIDWDKSEWNKEDRNDRNVIDIVHDNDGKIIATTNSGIEKQKNNIYISVFEPLMKSSKDKEILTKIEILTLKTGIDFEEYSLLEDDSKLGKNLNNLLRFKNKALNICKNKNKYFSKIVSKQKIKTSENQNTISKIEDLITNLRGKGYL